MAKSSQNIKNTRRQTDLSAHFSQLQTGPETYKMMTCSRPKQNQNRKSSYKLMRPYTDANSDGFSIAAHPAAKAGATFHVAINRG